MHKVKIANKRRWASQDGIYVSCQCNGMEITGMGQTLKEAEMAIRRTCILMKLTGIKNNDELAIVKRDIPTRLAIEKTNLPEWEVEGYHVAPTRK